MYHKKIITSVMRTFLVLFTIGEAGEGKTRTLTHNHIHTQPTLPGRSLCCGKEYEKENESEGANTVAL